MKKYFFVFLSIMLISTANGQEFKLIGGAEFSRYDVWPEVARFPVDLGWIEYNSECNYKKGFILGAGVEFNLTRNIAFEIDGLYFQKGSNILDRELIGLRRDYTLNVISIPMLIKIRLLPGSSPYILGGGELSIILSHKRKLIIEQEAYEGDIKENTKGFDYGLIIGGGFEIEMPAISPFVEVRYYIGLRDITKDYWLFEKIKTRAVAVLLGFKI